MRAIQRNNNPRPPPIMIYVFLTAVIPAALSAYYAYQLAHNRGVSAIPWVIANIVAPFIPLGLLALWKPKISNSNLRAQSILEESNIKFPMAMRPAPKESTHAKPGWIAITKWGITWIEASTPPETQPEILEWSLESAKIDAEAGYRDKLVHLWMMPPTGKYNEPVALVGGLAFMISRMVATATIIAFRQDNP